jgi:hypothetical protein
MRLIALSGLVLAAAAPPPVDDAREALRVAVAHAAPDYFADVSETVRPCLRPDTTPQHVRGFRHLNRPPRANPYHWFRDSASGDRRGEPVPPAEEARIHAAERTAWTVPAEPRSVARLDARWLQPSFRFCTGTGSEVPLEFSAPVNVGDLAFVSVDYWCVMCGRGMLFALERRATGWALLAWTEQWVS